jgi:hypothetical protein
MNDNNDINQNYALINNPLENNNENNNKKKNNKKL